MNDRLSWKKLESLGVFLVSLHSLLIGIGLIVATDWILDFAGLSQVQHNFFPRQSGVFHFIFAVGYWWEYRRHGTVGLLVLAKSCAVVFLLTMGPWKEAWSVPFLAATDGLMGVGMLVVYRLARRSG